MTEPTQNPTIDPRAELAARLSHATAAIHDKLYAVALEDIIVVCGTFIESLPAPGQGIVTAAIPVSVQPTADEKPAAVQPVVKPAAAQPVVA